MTDRSDYGASRRKRSELRRLHLHPSNLTIGRLRTANVLLITMKALANEIAKNLVLAGIGSLTIQDHLAVTDDDLGAQFFISDQDIGRNVRRVLLRLRTPY